MRCHLPPRIQRLCVIICLPVPMRPFVFSSLRIALFATPLFSHSSALPPGFSPAPEIPRHLRSGPVAVGTGPLREPGAFFLFATMDQEPYSEVSPCVTFKEFDGSKRFFRLESACWSTRSGRRSLRRSPRVWARSSSKPRRLRQRLCVPEPAVRKSRR